MLKTEAKTKQTRGFRGCSTRSIALQIGKDLTGHLTYAPMQDSRPWLPVLELRKRRKSQDKKAEAKTARPSVLKCSPRCPQSMKTGESRPCRSPGTGLPARSRCVRIDPQTATLQGPQGISAQVLACRLLVLVRGVSWRCQIVFSRPC